MFLEELENCLSDKEGKLLVEGSKTEDKQRQETCKSAEVEMEKMLKLRSLKAFQKKSYEEGDLGLNLNYFNSV